MYILKHYFKPEIKTDNSDFTKKFMKIGPVPDLQKLAQNRLQAILVLDRGTGHTALYLRMFYLIGK